MIFSKTIRHKISNFLLCFITLYVAGISTHVPAADYNKKYAAFVMDADTGFIFHRENANKKLHPASLTKMMTLILLFDALESGKLRMNTRLKISKHAASMIPSKIGLKPGQSIKARDAIAALATKSANDIAVAVAEKLGGSEKNFARLMTKKARSIGMSRTIFKNASGLHHPKQISTARDMAKLSRVLIKNYPKYYHFFSASSFRYQGKTYHSHNKLMKTYAGMDGLKTGYIRASGFNLAASAVRGNRRLIGVVFGGKTGRERNARMAQILDQSFAKIGVSVMANVAKVPFPSRKPITHNTTFAQKSVMPPKKKDAGDITFRSINRWQALSSKDNNSMLKRMITSGEDDRIVRRRIETGIIATSAHLKEHIPAYIWENARKRQNNTSKVIAKTTEAASGQVSSHNNANEWAVQVGAFINRKSADQAIIDSLRILPASLRQQHTTIAPLQTDDGWIFRGRLHGYTKSAAYDACKILKECIPVPPTTIKQ